MTIRRYAAVLDMDSGIPVRLLGSDSVLPVDGRLTNRNALLRAQEWVAAYAARKYIRQYIIVLFRAGSLSGRWHYAARLPVSADATIQAIENASN